jgi:hypothetical protein
MPSRFLQVLGTDSTGTGGPDHPVEGLGSLLQGSGADRQQVAEAAGAVASLAPLLGQAPHRTTLNAPNRFHLVRALTRFRARAGGPRVPCKVAGFYTQQQNQTS